MPCSIGVLCNMYVWVPLPAAVMLLNADKSSSISFRRWGCVCKEEFCRGCCGCGSSAGSCGLMPAEQHGAALTDF